MSDISPENFLPKPEAYRVALLTRINGLQKDLIARGGEVRYHDGAFEIITPYAKDEDLQALANIGVPFNDGVRIVTHSAYLVPEAVMQQRFPGSAPGDYAKEISLYKDGFEEVKVNYQAPEKTYRISNTSVDANVGHIFSPEAMQYIAREETPEKAQIIIPEETLRASAIQPPRLRAVEPPKGAWIG